MPNSVVPYDENYIEQCFVSWYAAGRPKAAKFVESEECPSDKFGRKPVRAVLGEWINERGWLERADVLDAQAETQINDELVALKVAALRKQASQAAVLRQEAFDHILEHGFDSSASAVAAFIKSAELERLSLGLSKTLERLAAMDDDEVLETVKQLAERAGMTTIDVAEIPEEDAESND